MWFEESVIIAPDADPREVQIEHEKPRDRSPRAAMAMKRDRYDGSQKQQTATRHDD
jgi:hypothetical protein